MPALFHLYVLILNFSRLGAPGSTQLRVWVRPKNASNVRIPTSGHLVSLIIEACCGLNRP